MCAAVLLSTHPQFPGERWHQPSRATKYGRPVLLSFQDEYLCEIRTQIACRIADADPRSTPDQGWASSPAIFHLAAIIRSREATFGCRRSVALARRIAANDTSREISDSHPKQMVINLDIEAAARYFLKAPMLEERTSRCGSRDNARSARFPPAPP